MVNIIYLYVDFGFLIRSYFLDSKDYSLSSFIISIYLAMLSVTIVILSSARVCCRLPRWHKWVVKSPPANAGDEMWVWSPGLEDPLEEGMATHSSILAWRITWRIAGSEEPGKLQSVVLQRVWAPEHTCRVCYRADAEQTWIKWDYKQSWDELSWSHYQFVLVLLLP